MVNIKINNKQDCKKFLATFKDGDSFLFRDSKISMMNGGATTITRKNDEFFSHSSGQNWSDQKREKITNPSSFVWKHRKDIVGGMWL